MTPHINAPEGAFADVVLMPGDPLRAKYIAETFLEDAKELITEYGVKKIIRVGSCGAVRMDVKVRDVIIGLGACTDSKVNRIRFKDNDFAAIADFDMAQAAVQAAKEKGKPVRVGNLFSADLFYTPDFDMFDVMEKYGILGVEMEAAGIYGVAAEYGAKALWRSRR